MIPLPDALSDIGIGIILAVVTSIAARAVVLFAMRKTDSTIREAWEPHSNEKPPNWVGYRIHHTGKIWYFRLCSTTKKPFSRR